MEGFFHGVTAKLLALSVLVQFMEYVYLRRELSEVGVWRWSSLRREYGPLSAKALGACFSDRGMPFLLGSGIVSALGLYAFPELPFAALVFAACLLMAIRFRGTFNGGSDFMTLTVAGALTFVAVFPDSVLATRLAFFYVGVQTVLSYFIAGLVKLVNREWRDGSALGRLLLQEKYSVPEGVRLLAKNERAMFLASWGILAFECTFPLTLFSLTALWVYLPLAALFHLMNVYVFGLNRFFFAWLATYPLLYYSCLQLH